MSSEHEIKPTVKTDPLYQMLRHEDVDAFNENRDSMDTSHLRSGDYRGRDLRKMNARGLNFADAYFRNADLSGIDFRETNLRRGQLDGCQGLRRLFPRRIEPGGNTIVTRPRHATSVSRQRLTAMVFRNRSQCLHALVFTLLVLAGGFGAAFTAQAQGLNSLVQEANAFLPVEEAYHLEIEQVDATQIRLYWQIEQAYYLYQHRFKVALADEQGAIATELSYSPALAKTDEFFGDVEVLLRLRGFRPHHRALFRGSAACRDLPRLCRRRSLLPAAHRNF